jgi:hypothetical protein
LALEGLDLHTSHEATHEPSNPPLMRALRYG